MKKCYTCQNFKDESDFIKNTSKKDGLNTICKNCSREKSRQYYTDNRIKHIRICGIKKKKVISDSRDKISEIKCKCGCQMGCGETTTCCLDFHHLRDKDRLISTMVARACCWKTIEKELKKCAVVCSNCHRKIHAGLLTSPTEPCIL